MGVLVRREAIFAIFVGHAKEESVNCVVSRAGGDRSVGGNAFIASGKQTAGSTEVLN